MKYEHLDFYVNLDITSNCSVINLSFFLYQDEVMSPRDAELEELKSSIQDMDTTTGKLIKLCKTLDQVGFCRFKVFSFFE